MSDAALTAAAYAALVVVMLPLLTVITPGEWAVAAAGLPAIVLATGWIARRYRLPAIAVTLAEVVVGVVTLTVLFLRDAALFGVVPGPGAFAKAGALIDGAVDDVLNGVAPLRASTALSFAIVAGMLVLAIIVDHVVLTAHLPLLATVALTAIWLIPPLVVPGEVEVSSFVLFAIAILLLLRLETRRRERDAGALPKAAADSPLGITGLTAAASGIGAVAVIVAIVAAPLVGGVTPRPGSGPGGEWNRIQASLDLGGDLRRSGESEVLQLRTTARSAPYLRVATLTAFDGSVWRPDRGSTVPLDDDAAFPGAAVESAVVVDEYTTSIEVTNLVSASAPVPYPALGVDGLEGDWESEPGNGTIVSATSSAYAQEYEVAAQALRPTAEQMRAAGSVDALALQPDGESLVAADDVLRAVALPDGIPASIGEAAREVTAGAESDYDALIALQRWFRSSEFSYSLEAPVQDGFDGTGADAVAAFLEVREGYCVHYASAFALMARTLGMPARIVVGYLPGSPVPGSGTGDGRVYSVISSQLHAWPEVFFDGIGWVEFEPTNSLGAPTLFSSSGSAPEPDEPAPQATVPPESEPAPTAPVLPEDDVAAGDGSSGAHPMVRILPWIAGALGVLALLAVPAAVMLVRRRGLLESARGGDAGAAWRYLQEGAIDLGIPVSGDESPRAFGRRLVELHGAPAADVEQLVEAIEFASYSPLGGRWLGPDLSGYAAGARAGLRAAASRVSRASSVVAPRSLLVRPGSLWAGEGNPASRSRSAAG